MASRERNCRVIRIISSAGVLEKMELKRQLGWALSGLRGSVGGECQALAVLAVDSKWCFWLKSLASKGRYLILEQ